jgi:hypothetical protein
MGVLIEEETFLRRATEDWPWFFAVFGGIRPGLGPMHRDQPQGLTSCRDGQNRVGKLMLVSVGLTWILGNFSLVSIRFGWFRRGATRLTPPPEQGDTVAGGAIASDGNCPLWRARRGPAGSRSHLGAAGAAGAVARCADIVPRWPKPRLKTYARIGWINLDSGEF